MKPSLKIDFADFWPGFIKKDNFFYNLLSTRYQIEICNNPDVLFYSVYGKEYLKFNCLRIFYTAENVRPDFTACDFAISFDFLNKHNHLRFPLYGIYIGSRTRPLPELLARRSRGEIAEDWARKTKFCCMVVSNVKARKRIRFFHKLSAVKRVDSGGRLLNNIGTPVQDKMEFIKDYKFVLSFENSSYPGYVTEKLLEPLAAGCIPVYWGNPVVERDFNKKRFLDYRDFRSEDDLIRRIMEIDSNDEEAIRILSEPIFPGNTKPEYIEEDRILHFLQYAIENRKNIHPVAVNWYKKNIHSLKRKRNTIYQIILAKARKITLPSHE